METIFNNILDSDIKLNDKRAKIITIEGIDGAGKTTIVDKCVEKLNEEGYKAVHFNSSSNLNHFWKVVNSGLKEGYINSDTNQLLHNIAFLTYLRTIFIELLNNNDFVLSEWYIYGKMVLSELYTKDRNANSKLFLEKEITKNNVILPDYSFYIDIPPLIASDRIKKRNDIPESKESLEMLRYAHDVWEDYIKKYNIERIDGQMTRDYISKRVLQKVLRKL